MSFGLGEIGGAQGGFNYVHSNVPYLGKPIPRTQITTIKQALDYAAAGFHVCVTQANKEPKGSNHYIAWQAAADDYYKAFKGSTLIEMLKRLKMADDGAAMAPRVTRTAPPKNPSNPATPVVNPNSSIPVPEQIQAQEPGFMEMQVAGFPLWAALLGVGLFVVLPRLMGKKRGGRSRAPARYTARRRRR